MAGVESFQSWLWRAWTDVAAGWRGILKRLGPDGQPALSLEEREVPEADALGSEIDAFLRAVRERETPPVTGWDGLRALEVAHVICESLETESRAAQARS